MLKLAERILEIKPKINYEINQLEESIKIAEELGVKGVAWALQMRHQFTCIKALDFPITTREKMEKIFKIDKEKEVLAESGVGRFDSSLQFYAGSMPYGCLLTIKELVDNKICNTSYFRIFYPESLPIRKDPILCIDFPNMDKITRFPERGTVLTIEDCILFKVWQWE